MGVVTIQSFQASEQYLLGGGSSGDAPFVCILQPRWCWLAFSVCARGPAAIFVAALSRYCQERAAADFPLLEANEGKPFYFGVWFSLSSLVLACSDKYAITFFCFAPIPRMGQSSFLTSCCFFYERTLGLH